MSFTAVTSGPSRSVLRDSILPAAFALHLAGIGGARAASDSGLEGLRDRLEALDGTLVIESLPGRGTPLRAEIPCGS